jgi:hypothetical protein
VPDPFGGPTVRLLTRTVLAVPVAVLGIVGAVTEGWPLLPWSAGLAVAGATGLAWLQRTCADVLPPLPHPATGALALATVPAVLGGALALGTAGGLVAVALFVVASVTFTRWLPADPITAPAPRTAVLCDATLRRVLRAAPTERLLAEWREVQERTDAGAPADLDVVRVREALLDELAARDPEGTGRWLAEDPTGLPDRHIGREPSAGC